MGQRYPSLAVPVGRGGAALTAPDELLMASMRVLTRGPSSSKEGR